MNKNLWFTFLIGLLCSSFYQSQFFEYINFGFKTGINYSQIKNVPEIFSQEQYSELVKLDTESKIGGQFGAFLNYRLQNTALGFQSELYYSQEHSKSSRYLDNELQYYLEFKFNYIQLNTLFKYYPTDGFNISIGPQFGFILNPYNIVFQNEKYPESTLQQQQTIRNSVKGRSNFQLLAGLGYEFEWGLNLDARYAIGFSDVIETSPANSLNWIENNNTTSSFQFTVGYGFGVSTY